MLDGIGQPWLVKRSSQRGNSGRCVGVGLNLGPVYRHCSLARLINVVSELMRAAPDEHVKDWVREVPPAMVYTTSVTLAEVRLGIARLPSGRRRALLASAADDVFGAFVDHILSFDAEAARHYAGVVVQRDHAGAPIAGVVVQRDHAGAPIAGVVVQRDHAGAPIAGFDAQIAAICRSHRAALATRNIDDFSGLGLDLIDPWLTDI